MAGDLVQRNAAMNSFIERAVMDPQFDVQKLEALLRMQGEAAREQSRREFNEAMAVAQAEMLPIIRDATNTHTNSKYAKLATIDAEMRPIYTKHGFSVRFATAAPSRDGNIRVVCTVAHNGGWEDPPIELEAPLDLAGAQGKTNKTGIQAVGSSVSYLRRYLLTMCFNIVLADDPDDDGEAARVPANQRTTRDRQAQAYGHEQNGARDNASPGWAAPADADKFLPLMENHGPTWMKNLRVLLDAATSVTEVVEIGGHVRVRNSLKSAPPAIRNEITALLKKAHERFAPEPGKEADPDSSPVDEATEALLAEIESMDADALDSLPLSAAWKVKTRDLFPPDAERVEEAIVLRRARLRKEREAVTNEA